MSVKTKEPSLDDFLTTKEVAELYGVQQKDVQNAIKAGRLQAQRIGYFYVLWKHGLPEYFPSS